jgi:hypothetical protein
MLAATERGTIEARGGVRVYWLDPHPTIGSRDKNSGREGRDCADREVPFSVKDCYAMVRSGGKQGANARSLVVRPHSEFERYVSDGDSR